MSLRVSVRRATLGDLDTVVELRLALLREYGDHPVYGSLRDDAEDRARDAYALQLTSTHEAILLAEHGGRVVGIMRCVDAAASPLLLPERYCYLSSVYVRPDLRRRGVLRVLLTHAERWCEERGITEMRLHNSANSTVAQNAWSAMGFDVVEQVRRRTLPSPALVGTRAKHHSHAEAR